MSIERKWKFVLDPEAPGLDEDTRVRRRVLARMQQMSHAEFHQILVHAGIYNTDGTVAEPYTVPGSDYRESATTDESLDS